MYQTRKNNNEIPYVIFGKLAALVLFMVALFLVVLFVLPEKTAAAGDTGVVTYTITSVQIQEGDSLWSLATEYFTEEFSSVSNYITEIKRMNGLSSDKLYAGNYILIPQYLPE